jgi:hypothetical protein
MAKPQSGIESIYKIIAEAPGEFTIEITALGAPLLHRQGSHRARPSKYKALAHFNVEYN